MGPHMLAHLGDRHGYAISHEIATRDDPDDRRTLENVRTGLTAARESIEDGNIDLANLEDLGFSSKGDGGRGRRYL